MPLTERSGAVAMPAQDLGNRGGLSGDGAVVTGKAVGDLGDATHVHGVMISAGEEGCAGRGAERRGVELVVAKPGTGHSVGTGPPKVLQVPNPTSSSRISTTLGASTGGRSALSGTASDSSRRRPIEPVKGGVGPGR